MIIEIEIDDVKKEELLDNAFASVYNYKEMLIKQDGSAIPNPQSKEEFALDCLLNFIKDVHTSYSSKCADEERQKIIDKSKKSLKSLKVTKKPKGRG